MRNTLRMSLTASAKLNRTIAPARYPTYGETVIQVDGSGSGLRLSAEVGPVDDGVMFDFARESS